MVVGVLTGTSEIATTREDISNVSHTYDFLGNHEYTTPVDLLPGTYELVYNLSSTETVTAFYVRVFDPDGGEKASVYGPPTVYQSLGTLTFETQRTGQHSLVVGGTWISVQVTLYKLTQSNKMVYPYEIVLYLGVVFLTAGVIASISGVLMKEKRQAQWYDKPS